MSGKYQQNCSSNRTTEKVEVDSSMPGWNPKLCRNVLKYVRIFSKAKAKTTCKKQPIQNWVCRMLTVSWHGWLAHLKALWQWKIYCNILLYQLKINIQSYASFINLGKDTVLDYSSQTSPLLLCSADSRAKQHKQRVPHSFHTLLLPHTKSTSAPILVP